MNEIVKTGLVGAAFLGGVGLLFFIINWLSEKEWLGVIFNVIMWILGIALFVLLSVVVGSVLLAGMD